ncbi:SMR family transporter [bacterium]|nr:SMR family transporter [bacterium]
MLNSFGAIAIKYGLNRLGAVHLDSLKSIVLYFIELFKSPLTILGFTAIFLSAFVCMTALSRMEISIAYPVSISLNFLIIVIFGLTLYHEPLTVSKVIGLIFVFISIFFLTQ